jgi:hypothetical protein
MQESNLPRQYPVAKKITVKGQIGARNWHVDSESGRFAPVANRAITSVIRNFVLAFLASSSGSPFGSTP